MTADFQKSILTGLRAIATSPILITTFLAAQMISKAPNFDEIYDQMFRGNDLSLMTAWLVDFWFPALIFVFVVGIAAITSIWLVKSPAKIGFISLGVSLLFFAIYWFALRALFNPLIQVINHMGQA